MKTLNLLGAFFLFSGFLFVSATSSSCGIKAKPIGLIKLGVESSRYEWPWVASLIHLPTGQFFCAANLIKPRIVLTAAHCIQQKFSSKKLQSNEVEIQLGKFNLNASEQGSKNFRPIEIIVHKDWNPYNDRYDADLALLVTENVMESLYDRPVCLSSTSFSNIEGTIAGWGFSSDLALENEMKLREVQVMKVSDSDCFHNSWRLGEISSDRTFCVTGVNEGAGPCMGDSGGGFFVKTHEIWFLHGIVSATLSAQNCPETKHSILTNIDSFYLWIEREAEEAEKRIDKYVQPENKQDHFDWKLSKALIKDRSMKNVVISPVFAKLMLVILAEADDQILDTRTKHELEQVLPSNRSLRNTREYFMKVFASVNEDHNLHFLGSKVFLDQGFSWRQKFAASIEHFYQTKIENQDFTNSQSSAAKINEWINESSNGTIESLISADEVKDSRVLLMSTVFYEGTWRYKFSRTFVADFHISRERKRRKTFMERIGTFYYVESDRLNARILRLPYQGRRLSMFIILPNESSDINDLIELLSSETVKKEISLMVEEELRVNLPMFRIESSLNLNDVLKQLGISEIFKSTANLPGLLPRRSEEIKVSNIIQMSRIHVEDSGGAAELSNSQQVRTETKEFYVNRPFIFFVEDDTTGATLFVGRIENPEL